MACIEIRTHRPAGTVDEVRQSIYHPLRLNSTATEEVALDGGRTAG